MLRDTEVFIERQPGSGPNFSLARGTTKNRDFHICNFFVYLKYLHTSKISKL